MATIKDVARLARVSVATVSYVINGTRKVAPETAERVRKAVEELDYHPDAVAQSLRTRKTKVIGVVVSDITNPFFATLVQGAEECARKNGYSLLICNTAESLENEQLYLQLLSRKRVDGMLLAPTGKNDGIIRRLIQRGMHIVFIDRKLEGADATAVLSQNEEGAYQATTYLLQQGHRRIGIILGLQDISTTTERLQGYRRALAEYGLECDPSLIAYGHSRVEGGLSACRSLLTQPNPPTALFVTNNLMTIGVMKAIREMGLRCPDDVSVVGFDDFEWTEAFDPPLTTVAQQPYHIGYKAVQLLLESIQTPKTQRDIEEIRVDVELRIRKSVKTLEKKIQTQATTSKTASEKGGE